MFSSLLRRVTVALILILIPHSFALAMVYPDVDYNHPFLRGIVGMTNDKLVNGYEDKSFHPDDGISRIEALKIVLNSAGIVVNPVASSGFVQPVVDRKGNVIKPATTTTKPKKSIGFPDIPLDGWYAAYVNTGEQMEIIHGYEDGLFRPANKVTRVESYKMLFRAFKALSDAPVEGEDWFTPYVNYALQHNLADYGDNPLLDLNNPHSLITRAEFTDLAFRMRNISPLTPLSRFSEGIYPEVKFTAAAVDAQKFGISTIDKRLATTDKHYRQVPGTNIYIYTALNFEEALAVVKAKFQKNIIVKGIELSQDNYAAGAYPFSKAVWQSPFEKTGLTYEQWYAMKVTSMIEEGYLKDKIIVN